MSSKILTLIIFSILISGCSAKAWKVGRVAAGAGLVGAGVGYAVVHHGKDREHQLTNTIISASVFAALGAGLTYWHLTSLEKQKIELAGKFSRSHYLESDLQTGRSENDLVHVAISGKKSLSLDGNTRWVFPEFRKRTLPPQRGESEIISSHYSWEIARPGFFVSREQYPSLFKEEELSHE